MNNSLTHKSKQFFWLLIKLSIVIGCGYFIWQKLILNNQFTFSNFYQNLIKKDLFYSKNIILLLFFTFLNHFLEIHKWQQLVSFVKEISFFEAVKQNLASLTTSLITPNRIGEYGAKAMYFNKNLRKKILGLNFIGNFYQLTATLFFGIIGFSYFLLHHKIPLHFSIIIKNTLIVFIAIFIAFFVFKNMKMGASYLLKIKQFVSKIPLKLNLKVAILSFLRYLVFSNQYYFLVLIFNIDISYINPISAITSIYLIASIVPMLSFFDVVLKGTVAIWVFSYFKIEPLTILSITTIMWIFNFVLPATVGSYFVLIFKPNFTK